MKMFESMVTLCYKDKVKRKSTKVLYACMVHGKGLGFFFYRGKERVIHIAMHVKIFGQDLSEVPFWAIGNRKNVSS